MAGFLLQAGFMSTLEQGGRGDGWEGGVGKRVGQGGKGDGWKEFHSPPPAHLALLLPSHLGCFQLPPPPPRSLSMLKGHMYP